MLLFEAGLERPYHELLGVGAGVDAKAIKRAYFQLSKEYHPDRYYRREIGPYAEKLDRIFRKIVEAYELLMDPTTRAELERSMMGRVSDPAPAATEPSAAPAAAPPAFRWTPRPRAPASSVPHPRRDLAELERGAGIPRRGAVARTSSAARGSGSARLAIAFDPWSDEYKKRFGELQAKVNGIRAVELIERAEAAAQAGNAHEALRLFEEALLHRSHDPVVNARAAEVALDPADSSRAREYAERAASCARCRRAYQRTLGRPARTGGLRDKAIAALNLALALVPGDVNAAEMSAAAAAHAPHAWRQAMSRVIGIDLGTTNSCVALSTAANRS